jgi:hypothetical protein
MVHIYTVEYYLAIKRIKSYHLQENGIELEIILLNKIRCWFL